MSGKIRPKLSKPDRPDNGFSTTAGFVYHLLRRPPELAFDPSFTLLQFRAWKQKVRRKLRQLLAFPRVPPPRPPKLIGESPRDGYVLQRWELYPEPHCVVPFLVLVPNSASLRNPAPAVLCFPGTDHPKEMLCGEPWKGPWKNHFGEREFMARRFVRAGFVAVAFDNPGTASRAHPHNRGWRRNAEQLLWLGRSYEGCSVFEKLVALRWLKTLPFVDRRRIAACGHSLGAKPALLLGVLAPKIRAVVWNDEASRWRIREMVTNLQPAPLWHYIPGFIRWFDYTDLMAAMAPTPLLISEGGRLDDHARIRQAYAMNRAAGNFAVTFMPHFVKPARRIRRAIPEGIAVKQYKKYANYDGAHYFKAKIAVPWLRKVFGHCGNDSFP